MELHNASSRSSFRQEAPSKQSPAKISKRPAFDLDNTGQDLELEGGRPDQPENSQTFHKNTILEPFDFASVQVSITERRLEQAFDILNVMRTSIDSRNFLAEFLTDEQALMLAKNKRNYLNYPEENIKDLVENIENLELQIRDKQPAGSQKAENSTRQDSQQYLDYKLQKAVPGLDGGDFNISQSFSGSQQRFVEYDNQDKVLSPKNQAKEVTFHKKLETGSDAESAHASLEHEHVPATSRLPKRRATVFVKHDFNDDDYDEEVEDEEVKSKGSNQSLVTDNEIENIMSGDQKQEIELEKVNDGSKERTKTDEFEKIL